MNDHTTDHPWDDFVAGLENALAHASPWTTKFYDRTNDQVTLDEVEKIRL